ncbi:MAG: methylthioribulose-1-phosphate dehydratase [Acidithiobacillales bacterium SG8_45]|nr:MAG: methylthioribulose-1-phosphate dehydratase [Acidithiobacillales bacterium SG8_45]
MSFADSADALIEAGRILHDKGWVPATSGNFSMRLDGEEMAITVSGWHKGELTREGIMRADLSGNSLEESKKPSAETVLHCQLYRRFPDIGAILHTHSMNATLISRLYHNEVKLEDYELLKAFPGVTTHESTMTVPVLANDQDIPRLARHVDEYMDSHPPVHGYLIAGHGLYTWGRDLKQTMRHLEAFEFLFACELKLREVEKP